MKIQVQQGRILWGITDDRVVERVILTYKQRDQIRRELANRVVGQFEPFTDPNMFEISFHRVDTAEETAKEWYVVDLEVKIVESMFFFSTSDKTVYLKTPGGKLKLTPYQLQQAILQRNQENI